MINQSLLLFRILRANKEFEWTVECEETFQAINQHLHTLLPLAKPSPNEPLFLYINLNPVVVSTILVKAESNFQLSVYYVSKLLADIEVRYLKIEKLRSYFRTHNITLLTNDPLEQFLQNLDSM